MGQIKKKIENGYVDFLDEIQNKTIETNREGYTKTIAWGAIITNYQTNRKFQRKYFDFVGGEIEAVSIKKGNVINLRDETQINSIYSNTYNGYYLIIDIGPIEITMEYYPNVADAVKAQKKMNYSVAVAPGSAHLVIV